jgi:CBS domain-containing protein
MEVFDPISTVLTYKSHHGIWTTAPETTVYDAIQLMADKNIGALPVMNKASLVGIISEREYTREVILKGKSSKTTHVQDIMTTDIVSVSPHDSAVGSMQVMTERKIRHLVVVDDNRMVGIVSIGDLVKWIITAQDTLIHQLEDYIRGGYPG